MYINKRFPMLFHPSKYFSIEEAMVKYKGRSVLKQYIPMKPIKRGFKVWVITYAVTGYCIGMSIYAENTDKPVSLGERVINTLSYMFGDILWFDNFFCFYNNG